MEVVGPYRLEAEIGRGTIATVYRALADGRDQPVALKLLSLQLAHQETYFERLSQQSQAVTDLHHPHIVPILETGIDKGVVYLVMPLLTGGAFKNRLADHNLPPNQLGQIVSQVAAALDAAHAISVVHRDLKPSNILFDDADNALVADFGQVQFIDTTIHASGMPGTLTYMSPEQFSGGVIDGRTDQYSLAIVAFEAITGRLPFQGNMTQLMYQQVHQPPPLEWLPNERVAGVLARALAKKPDERFETVTAFAAALQEAALVTVPTTALSTTALDATVIIGTAHLAQAMQPRPPSLTNAADMDATFIVEPPPAVKATTLTPTPLARSLDPNATFIVEPPFVRPENAVPVAAVASIAQPADRETAPDEWPPPPTSTGPVVKPGAGGRHKTEKKWPLLLIALLLLSLLILAGFAWGRGWLGSTAVAAIPPTITPTRDEPTATAPDPVQGGTGQTGITAVITPTATATATHTPTPSATPTITPTATTAVVIITRPKPQLAQYTCAAPGVFSQSQNIRFAWTWADQPRAGEYLEVRVGPKGSSAAFMGSVGANTVQTGSQWYMDVAAENFFDERYFDYEWEVVLVRLRNNRPTEVVRSARGCLHVTP